MTEAPRPTCADPVHLALVDAAFDRPGGPAGQSMRERLCTWCPVAQQCLDQAMAGPEFGVWGATTPILRTKHGAPSANVNQRTLQRKRAREASS